MPSQDLELTPTHQPEYVVRRAAAGLPVGTIATLALLLLVGCWLRVARLDQQLIGDDEVHLLRAALRTPFPQILYTYDSRDYSPPMAGLARAWLLATGRLPVTFLRVIPLTAGIGLLFACCVWARRMLATPTLVVWIGLLATSPWLIAYSRIGRSYAPLAALAVASCLATARWVDSRSPFAGLAATLLLALALWFHPLALALGLGCLVGASLSRRASTGRRSSFSQLATAVVVYLLSTALFLLPGWPSLSATLLRRAGRGQLSLLSLSEAARLLCGHSSWLVCGPVFLAAIVALGLALRRRSSLAIVIACQSLCLFGAVVFSNPSGASDPLPVARYLLALAPWLLLGPASIAGWAWERAQSRQERTALVLVLLFCMTAMVVTGPLAREEIRYTSLMHHPEMLRFTRPLPSVDSMPLPPSYRVLASQQGAVIEFPWWYVWKTAGNSLHSQRVHHLPLFASVPEGPLSNPRVVGPTLIFPDPNAWLASSARWLVLHADSVGDELRLALWKDPSRSISRFDRATQDSFIRRAEEMALRLEREWGPADISDDRIRVWDLVRVRSGLRR